jgi:hypothetical protein
VNCSDAKLWIGADPTASTADLEAHLATCPECRAYRDEMGVLEQRIRRVLLTNMPAVASPPAMAAAPLRRRSPPATRWLALAASVLVVIGAAVIGWWIQPPAPLARDVVAHMSHEPNAWAAEQTISPAALNVVLARGGVGLSSNAGAVTYAHSCWFRKKWTPHLVVQTSKGPLTVLILPGEHVASVEQFQENGYTGFIVPAQGGSVAVLSQGATDIDEQARAISAAIVWPAES